MKLHMMYGTGVIVLPAAVYPDKMPPDATYLHVLLALCADPALLSDADGMIGVLEARCRLPASVIRNAVSYWMEAGILVSDSGAVTEMPSADSTQSVPSAEPTAEAENAPQAAAEVSPAAGEPEGKRPRPSLPSYPASEYARILSESDDLRGSIDECARIAGKLFSEHETGQLVALSDTYGLDGSYLMTLFMYCRSHHGKTAVSYVVRTALSLYDEGVRTLDALEAHIADRERRRDNEYKIRRLFGLGERTLTSKEREYIDAWFGTYAMPMEVISRAYEITVQNIDTPRMSYVNKILSGWNENGIRSLEAIAQAEAEFEQKKAAAAQNTAQSGASRQKKKFEEPAQESSYDLDAFLEAAMKRSF